MGRGYPEPERASDNQSEAAHSRVAARRETILLVEDEDFVREVTREVLQFAGYGVLAARSASEALDLFASSQQRISLLLTDLKIPDGDGYTLAQQLMAGQPGLRTVLISGYPQTRINQDMSAPSGIVYLAKPFSSDVLMERVRRVLDVGEAASGSSPTAGSAGAS